MGIWVISVLASANNPAMSMGMSAFDSFEYIPRNGIARINDNSCLIFKITVILFSTAVVQFYISTSRVQVPFFQFIFIIVNTCFLFFVLTVVILMCMKWYLTMALICIAPSD